MKKLVAVLLAVMICLSLASCGTSVGIIGGADGDTEIIVEEK